MAMPSVLLHGIHPDEFMHYSLFTCVCGGMYEQRERGKRMFNINMYIYAQVFLIDSFIPFILNRLSC